MGSTRKEGSGAEDRIGSDMQSLCLTQLTKPSPHCQLRPPARPPQQRPTFAPSRAMYESPLGSRRTNQHAQSYNKVASAQALTLWPLCTFLFEK